MMHLYGNIPEESITGVRGPFLFTGGDAGFQMLHKNLKYDCTLVHERNPEGGKPLYPYTLDYGFQDKCNVERCPKGRYPGIWEVPLNALYSTKRIDGRDQRIPCGMADYCLPIPNTDSEVFEYLK